MLKLAILAAPAFLAACASLDETASAGVQAASSTKRDEDRYTLDRQESANIGAILLSTRQGGQPSEASRWQLYAFDLERERLADGSYRSYWEVERAFGNYEGPPNLAYFDSRNCPLVDVLLNDARELPIPAPLPIPSGGLTTSGAMEPAGPTPDGMNYVVTWNGEYTWTDLNLPKVQLKISGGVRSPIERFHESLSRLEECRSGAKRR